MKEKSFKRWLSLALAVLMIITAVPLAGGTFEARAEGDSSTEGYYTYTVENGEATITGCDESISGDVVIPSELGGYPVVKIGDSAFGYRTGLTSITIPDSVTSIGSDAFYDCTSLTSITIPDSVTSIGEGAFFLCSGLTSATLPQNITSISTDMFKCCTSLKNLTIPNNVRSINWGAFEGCTNLANVIIPDSVISIDTYAFSDCTSITSITIPDSVTSIGDSAFEDCTGLTSITVSSGNKVYHSENNCIINTGVKELVLGCKNSVIPSDGSVTSIGNYAFRGCTGLTSITIPNSVTNIGKGAFYRCVNLTNIAIGNSVESIGSSAFSYCTGLTSITIGNSVTNIDNSAFSNCGNLKRINWNAESVNDFSDTSSPFLFSGSAEDGIEVIFGDKVKKIPAYAFGCDFDDAVPKIKSVILGENVISIGNGAFQFCIDLKNVTIPDSVKSIGNSAFFCCLALSNIVIGNNVKVIGDDAFTACKSLGSVTIPKSVTNIDDEAFGYDSYGERVENFTIYGYAGTAAETYATENGFTFISLDDEHTHTFSAWTVTKEATCTAEGEETRTCSGCGAIETRKIEKKEHSLTHVEEDSTCKIQGVSYDICDMCGNTFNYSVLPLAPHTFGEWKVTKEATSFEYGERMRSCSVCGFEEKESIEKLPVSEIKDEKTGISVICPDGSYDGKVEIEVAETFDGTSYHVLNTEKGNFKKSLFDITTTIDGEKVQPNGSVFVKIPLPEGYNAEKTVVYYVTNDGKLERIPSRIENGYIIFETTHFSFYAIVDETEKQPENPSANCSCACHKKGIAKLFFKIKLFFQKIFKKNRVCKCGVNHY